MNDNHYNPILLPPIQFQKKFCSGRMLQILTHHLNRQLFDYFYRQYNQGTMLFLRNGAVIGTAPLRSQYVSILRSGAAPLSSTVFLQNL